VGRRRLPTANQAKGGWFEGNILAYTPPPPPPVTRHPRHPSPVAPPHQSFHGIIDPCQPLRLNDGPIPFETELFKGVVSNAMTHQPSAALFRCARLCFRLLIRVCFSDQAVTHLRTPAALRYHDTQAPYRPKRPQAIPPPPKKQGCRLRAPPPLHPRGALQGPQAPDVGGDPGQVQTGAACRFCRVWAGVLKAVQEPAGAMVSHQGHGFISHQMRSFMSRWGVHACELCCWSFECVLWFVPSLYVLGGPWVCIFACRIVKMCRCAIRPSIRPGSSTTCCCP